MKRAVLSVAEMYRTWQGNVPRAELTADVPAEALVTLWVPLERLAQSNTPTQIDRAQLALRTAFVRAKRIIKRAAEDPRPLPDGTEPCARCRGKGLVFGRST